jgi:hypothetical protein
MRTLLVVLSFTILTCSLVNGQDTIKIGNNPGNIINGGLIASDSDRIYYVSTTSQDGMFSMKHDGSDVKRLSSDYTEYINVVDGWLYYRKGASEKHPDIGGLYKMRTDGSQETRLTTRSPFYMNVVNDWIYFINDAAGSIWRVKTDGSGLSILYSGYYECLTTDGRYLYFAKLVSTGRGPLYKGSFDGHDLIQMCADTLWSPVASDGGVFYRDDQRHYTMCYIKSDGTEPKTLFKDDDVYDYFLFNNGLLYLGGSSTLKQFNIEKNKIDTLFNGRVIQLGVSANYIYFTTVTWVQYDRRTKTYLMKLDDLRNQLQKDK